MMSSSLGWGSLGSFFPSDSGSAGTLLGKIA